MADAGHNTGSWSRGRTARATEDFERPLGNDAHGREWVREPINPIPYIRPQRIPRLFKPGLAGFDSEQAHGWPFNGGQMDRQGGVYITPHLAIRRLVPDTRSGLTRDGDALRAGSPGRIPPVLVKATR